MKLKFSPCFWIVTLLLSASSSADKYNEIKILKGHTVKNSNHSPLPHTYLDASELPDEFSWANVNGVSFLTHNLNQHLPVYCGSCWAHGALSSLADRIKVARGAKGDDINLSIQFILNCGSDVAGSCFGGYHTGVYQLIKDKGFVPYDTCQPYMACSSDISDGFCKHVDTTCSAINTCRTCNTFASMGGKCSEIDYFPFATVSEYGLIENDVSHIKAEIFARGPVAATINASPIVEYTGGIYSNADASRRTNHIVSIVGWGKEKESGKHYWIVRNSWGHYWGEMGFIRVEMGQNILGIEGEVAWATPGSWTEINVPCYEDGSNCLKNGTKVTRFYNDPSNNVQAVERSLLRGSVAA